jgi:hypothetical protein
MPADKLIALLRQPVLVSEFALEDWNSIVEAGRKTQLLGALAALLRRAGMFKQVPPAVQRHLYLAELTAQRRSEAAMWEVAAMRRAIDPSISLVLLKGCAYVACQDINAGGRVFSDVDIMVRRQDLSALETTLITVGWKPSRVNAYDHAYYRNWMHEIPPMAHVRRHTVLDLHHAINPPISRYYVNPGKLSESLVEVQPGVFALGALDRVIHCALHLLQEGESKKLLRDLYDLHLLAQQHANTPESLRQLQDRAKDLGVLKLLQSAMNAAQNLFATGGTTGETTVWLENCVVYAARHANQSSSWVAGLAGTVVLAHSHWMKMPTHLLLPHLIRKAWVNQLSERQ